MAKASTGFQAPEGYKKIETGSAGKFIKMAGNNTKEGDFVSGTLTAKWEKEDTVYGQGMQQYVSMNVTEGKVHDKDGNEEELIPLTDVSFQVKPGLWKQLEHVQIGAHVAIVFTGKVKTSKGFSVNTYDVFFKE